MKKNLILVALIVIAILAGCGNASEDDLIVTQTFESALQTAVMQTVQAELEAAATEATPEPTDPPPVEEPTAEPTATFTPVPPTLAPTQAPVQPTSAPENTPATPCYRAEMISETIPDGTIFTPGKVFTKIWVIQNTGICEWTEDFKWQFAEGEDFGIKHEIKLGRAVQPGEQIEIKLEMQTPLLEGNYKGTWKIRTEDGASVTPLGFWVYVISQK